MRSELSDPQLIEDKINRIKVEIARLEEQLVWAETRRAEVPALHDKAVDDLAEINELIKLEKHAVKIRAIKQLAAQMFELQKHQGDVSGVLGVSGAGE